MAELVTLAQFQASAQHYHIYKIRQTNVGNTLHYHNYFQVCYVVSGEILHLQTRDSVTLTAGDAFIVPPGFSHCVHFNNAYSEMYSLIFEESLFSPGFPQSNAYQFLESLMAKAASDEDSVRLRLSLSRNQRQLMESLLESLILQQQDTCPPELSAAPSLTAAILYVLAQSYYQQPQNTSELNELAGYSSTLMQCVAYIDKHFREDVSLNALAKQFGLSRSSFCSVFPQFTGMPLRQYIAGKRIKEAQVLMRSHPEMTISQIALEVGYQDDSTFYRNFLHITGLPPSRYKTLFQSSDHTDP